MTPRGKVKLARATEIQKIVLRFMGKHGYLEEAGAELSRAHRGAAGPFRGGG